MYGPITIPFGAKLLFNTIRLKPGVTYDDVELALAEMCNVVKETYGGDKGGFIAGQVFRLSGFVSAEGSLGGTHGIDHDVVIATYWRSFDEHERSHADAVFKAKFSALAQMCTDSARNSATTCSGRGRRSRSNAVPSPRPSPRTREEGGVSRRHREA